MKCYYSIESNELCFIELFSSKYVIDDKVVVYYNEVMHDDDFFNRIYVKELDIDSINKAIDKVRSRGIIPFIYSIYKNLSNRCSDCSYNHNYSYNYSYSYYDELATLIYRGPDRRNTRESIRVDVVSYIDELDRWIDVFTASFSMRNYIEEVSRRIITAYRGARLRLGLALKDGIPVGCSAILVHDNIAGLYCLGVLKEHRRRGIATALISHAIDYALSQGYTLIVQTYKRDRLESLYSKSDFKHIYSKYIYLPDS